MSTVRAPYQTRLADLVGQSIASMAVSGQYADFYNRDGELLAHLYVKNPTSYYVKALRRIGSFDTPYRDILISDWYRLPMPSIKLANPVVYPGGSGACTAWSPDGNYLAFGCSTGPAPVALVYWRSGDTLVNVPMPGNVSWSTPLRATSWSPDGRFLIFMTPTQLLLFQRVGSGSSATMTYVNGGTGVLSSYDMTTSGWAVKWSPDGNYIAVSSSTTTSLQMFKLNLPGSPHYNPNYPTFDRLPDPAGFITNINSLSWSSDGIYLAVAQVGAPYVVVLKRNGDVFTRLPSPTVTPTGTGMSVAWSYDTNFLAVGHQISPYISVYKRDGDILTKIANSISLPGANTTGVSWTPDGRYLALSLSVSPFLMFYKLQDSTLTWISQAYTTSTSTSVSNAGVDFSPDGRYLAVATDLSPYINMYKSGAMCPLGGIATRINPNAIVLG